MSRRKTSPAKPWSKKKARARIASPDQKWAFGIIRKMLLDEHPAQLDATIDPAKRVSMLIGRGGTKTTTKRARALIKVLLLRNQCVGYAATSADQARELNWDPLKRVCEAYGITSSGPNPDVSFGDTKMVMRCHRTGSVYRMRGVEDKRDAEKFRGFPQAEFQVDECGSFDPVLLEYLVDECVGPRLGEALALPEGLLEQLADPDVDLDDITFEPARGGVIVLGSSPPKRTGGIFYDVTRPGSDQHRPYSERERPEFADWIGWSSHAWNLKDVVALPDADVRYPALVALRAAHLLDFKRKGWEEDHPTRKREYDGVWSEDNTTNVFRYQVARHQWDPFGGRKLEGLEALKLALAALPKDIGVYHFVLARDSGGTRDPFAINIFAFAPADPLRRLWHVFWLERMRLYAKLIAEIEVGPEAVKRITNGGQLEPYGGVFGVTGWPDAIVHDGEQPTIDELANVYGITSIKCDRRADYKFGAIELVNGDFQQDRIFVLKGSPLETQLQDLQWKADEFGILRENKAQANHSTDTLIYGRGAVSTLYESGAVAHEEAPAGGAQEPQRLDHGLRSEGGEDDDAMDAMPEELPDDFDDAAWGL